MKKHHSPKEYLDAAESLDTPTHELQVLAGSVYDFVRIAVANNPNTTSEILDSLVPANIESSNEQDLAAALTRNKRTLADTLALLTEKLIPVMNNARGNNSGFRAGVNVCCNVNTPFEAIRETLNYPNVATRLRKEIARETKRKDVLQLLLLDRSTVVSKQAQKSLKNLESKVSDVLG